MSDFKGIVLSSTTINENDVILKVLTPQGKISVKAKGVLKSNSKNRNVTEVGCYSYFHTLDRLSQQIYLLKNAECVHRFLTIQHDLIRKAIYSCFLEIMNKTDISFDDGVCFIEKLDTCENPYCLYCLLVGLVLKQSGISLVVDECVYCASTSQICGMSLQDGGFVCVSCYQAEKHLHLSVGQLKNIRYCMHASIHDYGQLEKNTTISFDDVDLLVKFLHQYGEFTIKSHPFLEILQPLV